MTISTKQDRQVREVTVGTTVIYTGQDGTFRYDGTNGDSRFVQIAFSYGQAGLHGLKCEPSRVAPADTPIPPKSDRVSVAKQDRGHYPPHQGPWLTAVDGDQIGFHGTKRDGVAAGLRAVAIRDWHAGTVHKATDPNDHKPIYELNTTGRGVRSYFGCSCGGVKPRTMPTRMSTMAVAYLRHVRELGIPRDNVADATHPEGTPAAGMTWDAWHAANPGRDPFTGKTDAERLGLPQGTVRVGLPTTGYVLLAASQRDGEPEPVRATAFIDPAGRMDDDAATAHARAEEADLRRFGPSNVVHTGRLVYRTNPDGEGDRELYRYGPLRGAGNPTTDN